MSVMGIQKASRTMEEFKSNLFRAFPDVQSNRMKRLAEKKEEKKLVDKNQKQLDFTWI
jgi:hypothetical protein